MELDCRSNWRAIDRGFQLLSAAEAASANRRNGILPGCGFMRLSCGRIRAETSCARSRRLRVSRPLPHS
jgi:hypothetical protein